MFQIRIRTDLGFISGSDPGFFSNPELGFFSDADSDFKNPYPNPCTFFALIYSKVPTKLIPTFKNKTHNSTTYKPSLLNMFSISYVFLNNVSEV